MLNRLKKEELRGPIVRVLPADPNVLDRELFRKVFGDEGPAPVPAQINLQTFLVNSDSIPLRD